MEAARRVARHELDREQFVAGAEEMRVVGASAADQLPRFGTGERRVARYAERGGASEIDEALPLRARERAAHARVRRHEDHAEGEHDSRTGERGHLEPHGESSRGSQERNR